MILIKLDKETDFRSLNIVKGIPYDSYTLPTPQSGLFKVSMEEWKMIQSLNTKTVER